VSSQTVPSKYLSSCTPLRYRGLILSRHWRPSHYVYCTRWSTENAWAENKGPELESRKTRDRKCELENAGPENAGPNSARKCSWQCKIYSEQHRIIFNYLVLQCTPTVYWVQFVLMVMMMMMTTTMTAMIFSWTRTRIKMEIVCITKITAAVTCCRASCELFAFVRYSVTRFVLKVLVWTAHQLNSVLSWMNVWPSKVIKRLWLCTHLYVHLCFSCCTSCVE